MASTRRRALRKFHFQQRSRRLRTRDQDYDNLIHYVLLLPLYMLNVLDFIATLVIPNSIVVNQRDQRQRDMITFWYFLFPCILNGLQALLQVLYLVMNDGDVLTNIHDYYYQYISKVRDSANHVHIKFSDMAGVFINYVLTFLEIFWQVLNLVLSCATYIGSWFLRSILHFRIVLVAHFPGGIPGIAFVIIIAFLVRKVHRLSKECKRMKDQQEVQTRCMADQQEENTRCMEDQQKLKLKLEDTKLLWQKETEKLNQDLEKLRLSNLSLEQERDERLCRICQDQIKTIVLLPCQHMCLCKPCLDRKKWKKCPMCRQHVESTIEVYV